MSAPSDGARADARKRLAAEVVPVDERIVAVLCEHDWFTPRGYAWPCCMCGEEFPDGDDAAFAHVAAALAGVIADAKAEAIEDTLTLLKIRIETLLIADPHYTPRVEGIEDALEMVLDLMPVREVTK